MRLQTLTVATHLGLSKNVLKLTDVNAFADCDC
jgi:hypothetical protein